MASASAMDTGLISLIFKCLQEERPWLLLLSFILFSCSSSSSLEEKDQEAIKASLQKLSSIKNTTKVTLDPGPTKKSTYFVESKALYGLEELKSVGLSLADWNGDGLLDLLSFPRILGIPEFYTFDSATKKFVKAIESPLPYALRAHFAIFEDINKDDVMDLIVGTMNQRSELSPDLLLYLQGERYQKSDGKWSVRFIEKSETIPRDVLPISSISLADIDLDGQLDIFVANWFALNRGQNFPERDRLYYFKAGKFVNTSHILEGEQAFNRDQKRYSFATPTIGVSSCDIDQNGFPDFLSTSTSGYVNKLWLNQADSATDFRVFKEYGGESGFASDDNGKFEPRGGGNTFSAVCTDYNNDGFLDIFIGEQTHSYDSPKRDRSAFLTNTGMGFPPTFLRTEYERTDNNANWSQMDRRVIFADFNLDGLIDMLVENTGYPPTTRLMLFKQEPDHSFTEVSQEWGIDIVNPSGVVVADIDRDGRPDILAPQNSLRTDEFTENFYLFLNRLPRGENRSVEIRLQGKMANKSGRGSLIKIKTKSETQTRWVDSFQGSMPAQNDDAFIVGLGPHHLEHIEVTWPFLKKGERKPTPVTYNFKGKKLSPHQILTLCESGKVLLGIGRCS